MNKSETLQQITVQEADLKELDGRAAILSWAVPVVVALILVIYFIAFRRRLT